MTHFTNKYSNLFNALSLVSNLYLLLASQPVSQLASPFIIIHLCLSIHQQQKQQTMNGQNMEGFITVPNPQNVHQIRLIPIKEPTELSRYFDKISKRKQNVQVIQNKLDLQLVQQIQEGKILIPKHKKSFKIKVQQPLTQEQIRINKYNSLEKAKQAALQKLNQLNQEQHKIITEKNKQLYKIRKNKSSATMYKRNDLTEEERDTIIKLIHKKRSFERQLELKSQQQAKIESQDAIVKNKRYEEYIWKMKTQNKKIVEKHMKKQLERKERQKELYESAVKEVQKLQRNKRYSHVLIAELASRERQSLNREREQLLQANRSRCQINLSSDIRKHQEKYYQIMKAKREEGQKNKSLMRESMRERTKSYDSCYFQRLIREQDKEERQKSMAQSMRGIQFLEKVSNYKNYVLKRFKPRATTKTIPKILAHSQSQTKHPPLTSLQVRTKGLEYLKIAKKLKNNHPQQTKPIQIVTKTQYKNYLRELPKRKEYQSSEHLFNNLIENQNSKDNLTRIFEAKILTQKMEIDHRKLGDEKLIYTVQNKLKLLSALM